MKTLLINAANHEGSNSTALAKIVLQDLTYKKMMLNNLKIDDIEDHRFDDGWSIRKNDDFYEAMDSFFESDLILMSSPIYWYSISARLSRFIERWSESLKQEKNFRNMMATKKLMLVLVGGDNPRTKAIPIIQQFEYITDFSNIDLYDVIIGCANRPGTIMNDSVAINKAKALNNQLKRINKG